MAFADLRAFLQAVDEIGELKTVPGADLKTEVGAITEITAWSPEPPMVLFEDIPGVARGYRIAVHSYASYQRTRLLYGFPDGAGRKELVRWWKNRLDHYEPVPPGPGGPRPRDGERPGGQRRRPNPIPRPALAPAGRGPVPGHRGRLGAAGPGDR